MDPITLFIIGGILFLIFKKYDCSSKSYKCHTCGHCFDIPESVGYDYCEEACPRCLSRNIEYLKRDSN